MKRLKDWPSRFGALVAQARALPFAWGVHDCCLWAADSVLACTGHDPAAPWRGTYSDAAGAMRLLDELGGLRAVGALAGPEIRPSLATVGDVGLAANPEDAGRELLVVSFADVWTGVTATGLQPISRRHVLAAWGVGRPMPGGTA